MSNDVIDSPDIPNKLYTETDLMNKFYDGMHSGVYMYAWMKDGVYYVGTTGRTLKEANAEIEKERQSVISKLECLLS
jgi:hypothetical protein